MICIALAPAQTSPREPGTSLCNDGTYPGCCWSRICRSCKAYASAKRGVALLARQGSLSWLCVAVRSSKECAHDRFHLSLLYLPAWYSRRGCRVGDQHLLLGFDPF